MVNAQNQLADELKNVSLSTPLFPVISNVEANEISGEEEIKSAWSGKLPVLLLVSINGIFD